MSYSIFTKKTKSFSIPIFNQNQNIKISKVEQDQDLRKIVPARLAFDISTKIVRQGGITLLRRFCVSLKDNIFIRNYIAQLMKRLLHQKIQIILLGWLAWSGILHAEFMVSRDTYEFKLSNGLRVIFKQDQRSPVIVHMVWYGVGGLDELNGTTGVAHVLEHMMFRGTKKLKPGEFSHRVAALGGRENAFTTKDFTAYYQQIDKKHLPTVMQLEADRMANLVISEKEFKREIKVVMEERRLRTEDRSQVLLHEQLLATAFISSPQRVPVVGWMNDLQTMTYLDAKQWYQKWYAPNNALLVIAGDAKPYEVRQLAQKYYGSIPARTLPSRKPQQEVEQRGVKRVELKASAENPLLIMAYKVPVLRDIDKDYEPYALMILDAVFNGYANSRLQRNLVRDQRVADSIETGYIPLSRGPQLFYLSGTPAKDKTIDVLETNLRNQVATLIKEGLSDAELKRIKAQIIANKIFKKDALFSQAMEIGITEMSGVSWRYLDRMLEKIDMITSDQVQTVAKKYLRDDYLTIASLIPLSVSANTPAMKPLPIGLPIRHLHD